MNERILVVDDNADGADSLAKLIGVFGYEAKAVYSGHQAIEATKDFLPDMALIDIGMPHLNGFEAVERIRELRLGSHVILVAVTAWTSDEDKRRAYDAGFDLHVGKPMSAEMLEELLALLNPAH
jgi:CheY-like chemotaxis protein